MDNIFSTYESELKKILQPDAGSIDYDQYRYFIKGDVSGIQEFIFNVKSEKAAKTLKARSYFIQALGKICIFQLNESLSDLEVFYDGGGNFYLFTNEDPASAVSQLQQLIDADCKKEAFYVVLNFIDRGPKLDQYSNIWDEINRQSNTAKLKKFQQSIQAFEAYTQTSFGKDWAEFTTKLNSASGFKVTEKKGAKYIKAKSLGIFDSAFSLDKENTNLKNSIVNKTPTWRKTLWEDDYWKKIIQTENNKRKDDNEWEITKDSTIDFHFLAKFAHQRTGTEKLGILKLDVDNLGTIFRGIPNMNELKKLSLAMDWFFDKFLLKLWREPFNDNNGNWHLFSDNIYVVFSGGDDCFMVGPWDAIFDFANLLQSNFDAFVTSIKKNLPSIHDKKITISAGMLTIDPKFPVVRFAQLAENALEAAKNLREEDGSKDKNKINVFSQVIEWSEYKEAKKLKTVLYDLVVNKNESRALLDRIKRSAVGYAYNLKRAKAGNLPAPKVWKLFYFLRNIKDENNRQILENNIIRPYSLSLLNAFIEKGGDKEKRKPSDIRNPATFPIAARWAEFMTKKKD